MNRKNLILDLFTHTVLTLYSHSHKVNYLNQGSINLVTSLGGSVTLIFTPLHLPVVPVRCSVAKTIRIRTPTAAA